MNYSERELTHKDLHEILEASKHNDNLNLSFTNISQLLHTIEEDDDWSDMDSEDLTSDGEDETIQELPLNSKKTFFAILKNIRTLNLDGNNISSSLHILLPHMKNIRSLSLRNNGISAANIIELLTAVSSSNIEELYLSQNNLMDAGAAILANNIPKTLKLLHISYNIIGLKGADALARKLKDNKTLESFSIMDNPINMEGVFRLFQAFKTMRLKTLIVGFTNRFQSVSIPYTREELQGFVMTNTMSFEEIVAEYLKVTTLTALVVFGLKSIRQVMESVHNNFLLESLSILNAHPENTIAHEYSCIEEMAKRNITITNLLIDKVTKSLEEFGSRNKKIQIRKQQVFKEILAVRRNLFIMSELPCELHYNVIQRSGNQTDSGQISKKRKFGIVYAIERVSAKVFGEYLSVK
ncbi:hypothetical protein HDV06_000358 [Boothiomyces sp. JEL0866]|nr:hypothetical protein HDV06_000358 [Boothiomyces sp. JEL0866]